MFALCSSEERVENSLGVIKQQSEKLRTLFKNKAEVHKTFKLEILQRV